MQTSTPAIERRRFLAGAFAGVVAVTSLVFSRVMFAGEWLAGRDTVRVHMPLAKYWADRIRHGELPEWYPYDALGQPFIAMMLSAAFHPSRLLYLVLPVERALTVNTLLCYPLAAFGTYGCARLLGATRYGALFGAITFAFSGYVVGISNNFPYLVGIATMPWALWAAERFFRRPTTLRALLASAVLASICLAGETQIFFLSGGVVTLLAIIRTGGPRWPVRLALAFAVTVPAVLLAAPQILPALDGLKTREGLNPLTMAQSFSVHPVRLLELLFGPIFISENIGLISAELGAIVDPKMNSTWVDSLAVGTPAVAFAFLAASTDGRRRVGAFVISLGAVALLLMLGSFTPLYGLFYKFVPVWSVFRYPEKLAPWVCFIVALGAAVAVSHAFEDEVERRRAAVLLLAGAAVCALVAAVAAGSDAWSKLLALAKISKATWPPLTAWFVLNASGTAIATFVIALVLWRIPRSFAAPLVICVQAVLLLWYGLPLPQTVGLPLVSEPVGFMSKLLESGHGKLGGPRVQGSSRSHAIPESGLSLQENIAFGMFTQLEPDLPALFGMEATNYYLPAGSGRLVRTIREANSNGQWVVYFPQLYGADHLVFDKSNGAALLRSGAFDLVEENVPWGQLLVRARNARPRAFVAHPRCVTSVAEAVATIQAAGFRSEDEALVECDHSDPPNPLTPSAGTAQIRGYAPERVEVEVDAADGSLLVLNDAYYEGWTATVDGEPAQIIPANVAVRGVRLTAGTHKVVFAYRQSGLRSGLALAGLTVLMFVIAAVIRAGGRSSPK